MSKETLKANLREIPDFPIPGILFYDVTTLFKNHAFTIKNNIGYNIAKPQIPDSMAALVFFQAEDGIRDTNS